MLKNISLLALLLLTFSYQAKCTDLNKNMKNNFEALMNLQTFAADPQAFTNPKNKEEIQKNLDSLSEFKHVFSKDMKTQEPGLAAIAQIFSNYLEDIQQSFKSGANGSYIRNQVRTMSGFCLNCHTRVSTEQNFIDSEKRIEALKLTEFQKAEFYAATRQFNKALTTFNHFITTVPKGELAFIDFTHAVRQVLSITVRVQQNPSETLKFLSKLEVRKDIPEYFQHYITEWKKSAQSWLKEKSITKHTTDKEFMQKARALVDQAKHKQVFAVDPSADIQYLRATNYLHEALQKSPSGSFRAEALYLLGSCYDALNDPLLWALDGLYFEACIREFPHSKYSKKCYQRYAAKVYFGYSGSGGTTIPEDEVKNLIQLRKLAE